MKKSMSIAAMILLCAMILPCFAVLPTFGNENSVGLIGKSLSVSASTAVPGRISSCAYDLKTDRVRIKGSLSTSAVRDHADCTIAIFALGPGDKIDDIEKGKLIPAKSAPKADSSPAASSPTDYEPTAGAPVVDTNGNATTTLTAPPEDEPTSEAPVQSWQPPTGELPL